MASFDVVHSGGGGNYFQINGLPFTNYAATVGQNLGQIGYQNAGLDPVFIYVTTGAGILFTKANATFYTYANMVGDNVRGAVAYHADP